MSDLIIEGLVKLFGKVRAVDNVSLTVKSGTLTTLLGPSGCGKTTTLNSIAGLDPLDEGVIRVGDFVLNDSKRGIALQPEERELGMVFQSYALWPHMKVRDNLAFGLKLKKVTDAECKKRIDEVLELVSLTGLADRYPFQLSGGQQQRVALARAVVTQPRLLLLDEPLSNLDAKVRESARFWLRDFQKRLGITTVYVTHDQAEALAISDMVAVMSGGKLLQYAAPRDIYERPATRFVADFIGVTSFFNGTVVEANCVRLTTGEELAVTSTRGFETGKPVLVSIRSERVQLLAESTEARNSIKGRIVSSVYLGSKWQHMVETAAGRLHIETMDAAPGSDVRLGITPDDVYLLNPE